MEKCDFCISRQEAGIEPACTSACPTGALRFGQVNERNHNGSDPLKVESVLPFSALVPALETSTPHRKNSHPLIIPETDHKVSLSTDSEPDAKIKAGREWSLILFSILSSHLFALNFSSWNSGVSVPSFVYLSLIIITAGITFLHLGSPAKAFLALQNIKSSPISMEIAGFCLYSLSSVAAWISGDSWLWIVSFISGLVFLYLLDSVYTFFDKRTRIRIHPGQVFLGGLMLASYYSSELIPFIFIACLRLITGSLLFRKKPQSILITVTLTGYLLILVAAIIQMLIMSEPGLFFIVLIALGELGIRTVYFLDLSPVSITKLLYLKTNDKEKETTG
jgi:DMSO reductase anchor subunit